MKELLEQCWENDIVTVVAAGNLGSRSTYDISQDIPSCLGAPDNPLITVGASTLDGRLWAGTTAAVNGRPGSISIWALGESVLCAAPQGNRGFVVDDGTSLSTGQISGLAAYYMSLPLQDLSWNLPAAPPGTPDPLSLPQIPTQQLIPPDLHITGTVSQAVKDYLVRMSYPRKPGGVNVAYNGAEESPCAMTPWDQINKRQHLTSRSHDNYTSGLIPLVTGELDRRQLSSLVD